MKANSPTWSLHRQFILSQRNKKLGSLKHLSESEDSLRSELNVEAVHDWASLHFSKLYGVCKKLWGGKKQASRVASRNSDLEPAAVFAAVSVT